MVKKTTQTIGSNSDYDILIIGGGMVGASLAVALLPLNLKVALVDAFEFGVTEQPSYDDRAIALSYGSSRIYQGMGLWDELQTKTTTIDKIHISDRGHFGATRLSAKKEKVPALGYLVESRILGKQLYDVLDKSKVDIIVPATVTKLQESESNLTVTLLKNDKEAHISTRLLIASDGTQSKVRELSGINVSRADYQQSAVIANISTEKTHNNEAFERFTDKGPIALLPLSNNRCSLVWTHDTKNGTDDLDETLALDDAAFLKKLGNTFGYRLGRFTKVGKRSSFPLGLLTADKNTAPRTVIIGNASHTMHPVAGQGLNLALRDIAVLADLISSQLESDSGEKQLEVLNVDIGNPDLLNAYEELRDGDIKTTVRYTDSLVRLFSNDNMLLGHARAGGLLAVDRLSPLRNWVTRQSMGINYRQSRLARGLSLKASGAVQ